MKKVKAADDYVKAQGLKASYVVNPNGVVVNVGLSAEQVAEIEEVNKAADKSAFIFGVDVTGFLFSRSSGVRIVINGNHPGIGGEVCAFGWRYYPEVPAGWQLVPVNGLESH